MSRKLTGPLVMTLLVLVVACGGDDDTTANAPPTQPTVATTPGGSPQIGDSGTTAAPVATTGAGPVATTAAAVSGQVGAVITIGDERFAFDSLDQCLVVESLGGIQGQTSIGDELYLGFVVNDFAQNIYVDTRDAGSVGSEWDREWRAEPWDAYPETNGATQVDTYTVDGSHASGTATFLEMHAYLEDTSAGAQPVAGTFDIDCGS